MIEKVKDTVIGVVAITALAGLAYAGEQRIDQRVSEAITSFQEKEIERQIRFFIIKSELTPAAVTPDDRINKRILEEQLKSIRSSK